MRTNRWIEADKHPSPLPRVSIFGKWRTVICPFARSTVRLANLWSTARSPPSRYWFYIAFWFHNPFLTPPRAELHKARTFYFSFCVVCLVWCSGNRPIWRETRQLQENEYTHVTSHVQFSQHSILYTFLSKGLKKKDILIIQGLSEMYEHSSAVSFPHQTKEESESQYMSVNSFRRSDPHVRPNSILQVFICGDIDNR